MQKHLGKSDKKPRSRTFLITTLVLTFLGILAVADASAPQAQAFFSDSFYFVKQQLVWGALGIILLVVGANIHYSFWRKVASYIFIANLALLIIVLIPGIGNKILGARRWLVIGPVRLQPSELVKFSLAIYMAKLIELKRPFKVVVAPLLIIIALIMLQPDLGTTLIVIGVAVSQLFIAGISLLPFLGLGLGGGLLGSLLVLISKYRRERFQAFIQSLSDPLASSYHLKQVLIALGSGGIFGVGLGQGRQKYLFLPEAATDSVFATIAEEVGFIGAIAIILGLVFFIYKAIRIAQNAPDTYSLLLAAGIVAWLGGQIFLNLASMVALIPITGVPLPFFSYGGSSLTVILFGVGILLNIERNGQHKAS